jgi:hypothetical protein
MIARAWSVKSRLDSFVFRYDGEDQHRVEMIPEGGLAGGESPGRMSSRQMWRL